jgi:hypothetical protein
MNLWEKNLVILIMGFLIQGVSYADGLRNAAQPVSSGAYVKSLFSLPLTLDPVQMNDGASLVVEI